MNDLGKQRMLILADFLDTVPPGRFDMSEWGGEDFQRNECGSAACALGWGMTIPSFKADGWRWDDWNTPVYGGNVGTKAAAVYFDMASYDAKSMFLRDIARHRTPRKMAATLRKYVKEPLMDATSEQPREEGADGAARLPVGPSWRPIVKHMVDRFLWWKLPEDFNPDCGISFTRHWPGFPHPGPVRYEPVGTNLLTAAQAEAMVRHMIEGMPDGATIAPRATQAEGSGAAASVPDQSAEIARLKAFQAQLVEALRLHQAWTDSERAGPNYGELTRDTHPDGERIWRQWWDGNLDLCARAEDATLVALKATEGR